jgi:hypothetical protein
MADDFQRKFEGLANKLTLDPKKDSDLKKALAELSKALKSESDDYSSTLKDTLSVVGKKKKDAKDKDQKKLLEQLESLADDDMAKRFAFKDASSSPS